MCTRYPYEWECDQSLLFKQSKDCWAKWHRKGPAVVGSGRGDQDSALVVKVAVAKTVTPTETARLIRDEKKRGGGGGVRRWGER